MKQVRTSKNTTAWTLTEELADFEKRKAAGQVSHLALRAHEEADAALRREQPEDYEKYHHLSEKGSMKITRTFQCEKCFETKPESSFLVSKVRGERDRNRLSICNDCLEF